ncbi:hypothetical protein NB069_10085 [Leclercia adecarboxylata]|uniref:hypothetical protein n=1 Tax=Leclercia adecarboxylata TaxID=83655 RepID=UPI002029EB60|nr:hypothetical protein [Leclercia adecarboxylata]URO01189.1 hypothetical protein NB069_10085 [Leclercia adecarboxylata]
MRAICHASSASPRAIADSSAPAQSGESRRRHQEYAGRSDNLIIHVDPEDEQNHSLRRKGD